MAGSLRKLINTLSNDAQKKSAADQHIGWIRMFAQDMKDDNWKDLKLRIERQLDQLEKVIDA